MMTVMISTPRGLYIRLFFLLRKNMRNPANGTVERRRDPVIMKDGGAT